MIVKEPFLNIINKYIEYILRYKCIVYILNILSYEYVYCMYFEIR